jgi:hypothetical protein
MASRNIQRLARSLGASEIHLRAMVQRGYRAPQLERMFAPEGSVTRLAADAADAAIRRRVRLSRNLPCGEPVRINSKAHERDVWLAFQFQTGTHGDQYVTGGGGPREIDPREAY